MKTADEIHIDLTINLNEKNLRRTEEQRVSLSNLLNSELSEDIIITHPISTRSIDPLLIGTVSLAILPIVAEKLGDLVIKWLELHKDCSITIKIPIKTKDIEITYNPKTTSPEKLKSWINDAVTALSKKE